MKNKFLTKIPLIFSAYIFIFLTGLAFSLLVIFYLPEHKKYFIKENGLVENLGAGLFFLSGLIALFSSIKIKSGRAISIFYSILSFTFFLDEISWGVDIFKYKPYRILGVKIDAIHDLFDVLLLLLSVKHEYFFYSWLITLLLIGLILFILIKKWKFIVLFISKERGYFLGMIVLFFLLSLAIDTHNVKINGANLFILEEYFEFSAAMALFFLCSSFPIKSKPLK